MEGHGCIYIVEPYLWQGSTAEIVQKRRWGWGGLTAGSLRRQSVIPETVVVAQKMVVGTGGKEWTICERD